MLSLLVGTITSYRKQSSFVFDTFFELCRKFNIQYSIATTQKKPPHKAVNINSFCCRNCDVTDIPVDRRCIYLLVMKEYESVEIR